MEQEYVCSITPTEYEKYCLEILKGYAEKENLKDFSIKHNVKIPATDGTYQIDVYATFTAMNTEIQVLCECKQYSHPVSREKVAVLNDKLQSLSAQKGILMSTSGFQSGAIEYAKVHKIALIHVYDRGCDFLSHSNGSTEYDEDDPFMYGEKHLPPYVAIDCTDENEEQNKVYPTKSMIREIYAEMDRLINEQYSISINFPDLDESEG